MSIRRTSMPGGAAYEIGDASILYLKYSTARLSPWNFTFHPTHWEAVSQLKSQYSNCVVGLICKDDGIAALTGDELLSLRRPSIVKATGVAVKRAPRHHYSVSSGRNELPYKISRDELLNKLKGARVSFPLSDSLPWPMPRGL